MHYRLPESVMVNQDTKMARWDYYKKIWRTGGMDDIKIDIGQYILRFQLPASVRLMSLTLNLSSFSQLHRNSRDFPKLKIIDS